MDRPALPEGLYGIVDDQFPDPLGAAAAFAAAGCRVVQLRAKRASPPERRALAAALVRQLRPAGVRFIVNDDLACAMEVGADGVHLGEGDGSPAEARARLGPTAHVGWSTHTLAHIAALDPAADHIGFGPVFGTRSKESPWSARGLDLLAAAVARSPVPVVAIGGVDLAGLPGVRAAGARHWAVISAVLAAPDREAAARALMSAAPLD